MVALPFVLAVALSLSLIGCSTGSSEGTQGAHCTELDAAYEPRIALCPDDPPLDDVVREARLAGGVVLLAEYREPRGMGPVSTRLGPRDLYLSMLTEEAEYSVTNSMGASGLADRIVVAAWGSDGQFEYFSDLAGTPICYETQPELGEGEYRCSRDTTHVTTGEEALLILTPLRENYFLEHALQVADGMVYWTDETPYSIEGLTL